MVKGLCGFVQRFPEGDELALVHQPDLQRSRIPSETSASRSAWLELLIAGQPGSVGLELGGGDHLRVGAEEDLEQRQVAQLGELVDGPASHCRSALRPALVIE